MAFIPRRLAQQISAQVQNYPITVLTGPRQSGKTTLLKNMFPDYRYVSLEDLDVREYALEDPIGFLNEYDHHVLLDEVQEVPQLFSYLQRRVDESKEMGQYILSGSQNFHLMESITQSLAGRVAIFRLLPFDFSEMRASVGLGNDWLPVAVRGFYPALIDRGADSAFYFNNYLQTYIQRDVSQLDSVPEVRQFRNFLALCASRSGQLVNYSSLSREAGISQHRCKEWLSILESSYILFQLPPYFQNFSKRIVKSAKYYFYDTGLLAFLLGIRDAQEVDRAFWGMLFENMIVSEMMKKNEHLVELKEYFFWRDSNGNECDVLLPKGVSFDVFEIKASQTISSKMFKGMDFFDEASGGKASQKTLIYGGASNQDRTHYIVRSWRDFDTD